MKIRRSEISAISTNIKKRQVRRGKKYWNSTANSRTPVIPVAPFQNTVLQQQRRSVGTLRPYTFIKSLMTHWYQTTDTDTNASPCRQKLMKLHRWWNIVTLGNRSGGGCFSREKPPRYRINFRAVESLKNLNFERNTSVTWVGGMFRCSIKHSANFYENASTAFFRQTITNRVCRPDMDR